MDRRGQIGFLARERMIARILVQQRDVATKMAWMVRKAWLDRKIRQKAREIKEMVRQARLAEADPDPEIMIKIHIRPAQRHRGGQGRAQNQNQHKALYPHQLTQEALHEYDIPVQVGKSVLKTQVLLMELQQEQRKMIQEANKVLRHLEM